MGILCRPKELGFYLSILEDFEAFKSGDGPSKTGILQAPATVGGGGLTKTESDEESPSVDQARNQVDQNKSQMEEIS